MPWGPIKVSDYAPLEGEGREEGLPAAAAGSLWLVVLILTDHVLQDLKEKKLLEEKENGKGAATNGKVRFPSVI